jgi:hypothetical protein
MENPAVFQVTIMETEIRAIHGVPNQETREEMSPRELRA